MTSMSTDDKTSTSIDRSTQKSTDVSSCVLVPDVDMEITMGDLLELKDEAQPENMDHNLEKKLDDYQHASEKDLETSQEASIDRYPPDCIDRHPPESIELHPPESIDRHPLLDELHGFIVEMEPIEETKHESEASRNDNYKHLRPLTCAEEAAGLHKRVKRIHDPVKIVVPCAVVDIESPIPPDRSMQFSSYIDVLDDHQHVEASQRGLRFQDEVDKGPAELVSIDTDRTPSMDNTPSSSIDITTSPSIDTGRVSEQKEFDVSGNIRDGDTTTRSDKSGGNKRMNWKKRKRIMDDSQLSLIPRFSDGVRKSRDETTPENLDHNLEKKLDEHQHTSEKDLETSLEASIDRHQPDEVDRQPPHIIDLHPFDIDRHRQPLIDRHHPPNIDRCPLLDLPPGCIIEMEPIEERMYMSKASHLAVPKHQRPPIWTEEAAGLHKRVKRIHDPAKIVVPCAVIEVEFPIPPDKSVHLDSYSEILDDHQHVEASQRGLRFQDEVYKVPAEPVSVDTDRIPSIDTNKPASIDTTTSPSIDTTPSTSIGAITSPSIDTGRLSE
ncbi:hypothetical protein F2Q70_00026147 [Brassica cretica]|uniref:Uncharacterized protein n=1 Tax=Brassica cretica TaxID=69181 RepID=A0A8S9LHY8_BRACR|nr:hypothetical protein F2Q70_00026147 [Brassica cretica]